MSFTPPRSTDALDVLQQVRGLQAFFVERLSSLGDRFSPIRWLRDEGRHGGGERWVVQEGEVFGRASLNVSCVHYDDMPDKKLSSATALSCIVHPRAPWAPSMHMHISWTELRSGRAYWRVMADLNPSNPVAEDTERVRAALASVVGEHLEAGLAQGDRYFHIPALERHRGVVHFYLEAFSTEDAAADRKLAEDVVRTMASTYTELVAAGMTRAADADAQAAQLAYHTVYLFQVLTMDRGTTSGILVHDQNDVGILGSLPSPVDRGLLASWRDAVPEPQERLVDAIVATLPEEHPCPVDDATRARLAAVVRAHYRAHPEALALQASGSIVPPTVANHR